MSALRDSITEVIIEFINDFLEVFDLSSIFSIAPHVSFQGIKFLLGVVQGIFQELNFFSFHVELDLANIISWVSWESQVHQVINSLHSGSLTIYSLTIYSLTICSLTICSLTIYSLTIYSLTIYSSLSGNRLSELTSIKFSDHLINALLLSSILIVHILSRSNLSTSLQLIQEVQIKFSKTVLGSLSSLVDVGTLSWSSCINIHVEVHSILSEKSTHVRIKLKCGLLLLNVSRSI